MSPETKALLVRFDVAGAYEFPPQFDYPDLERRAKLVLEDIRESGVDIRFEGAVHNQDASFSIAIVLRGLERKEDGVLYQPTVRFSNFGSLATMTFIEFIPVGLRERIRASLAARGFVYVDADELDCEYDGVMSEKADTFRTWWIRYFDWL